MKLRPYQKEALHGGSGWPGIYKLLGQQRRALLVMATGTGKTVVFGHAIAAAVERGHRTLVLAHRKELLHQAADKVGQIAGLSPWEIGVELASERANGHEPLVVASVASLHRRLDRFAVDAFGLVVVDEAHHAPASTYRKILDHFEGAWRLGVTATPDRLDGKGLGSLFAAYAYVYSLAAAIRDGWALRPRALRFDVTSLDSVTKTAGDFNQGGLSAAMRRPQAIAASAKAIVDHCKERPTFVYGVDVLHAEDLTLAINGLEPGSARVVHSQTEDTERDDAKEWLLAAPGRRLVNCTVYTEGVDIPEIAAVVVARPTMSRTLYAQMVGRGTRILGRSYAESVANGKTYVLVVDLVGATRHNLATLVDVLEAGIDDEDLQGRVKKKTAQATEEGEPLDILEAISEAETERAKALREKAKEEHAKRITEALKTARYRPLGSVDPWELLGIAPSHRSADLGAAPITQKQADELARHRFPGVARLSFAEAQQVLAKIAERKRKGLCSLRQSNQLAKYGLNPDATAKLAGLAMSRFSEHRWRVTPGLLEDLRKIPGLAPE